MQRTYVFNETSPAAAGTAASSAAVTNSTGAVGIASCTDLGRLDTALSIYVVASLVGATGGTLDVYLQTSPDFGTTWADFAHFPQLASGATAIKYAFAASKCGQLLTPAVVGVGTTPALAANTVAGGGWGDRFRLVMVAGASTTVGAPVQVFLCASSPLTT